MPVMVGAVGEILKALVVTVPPGVVIVIGPVAAPPPGTTNVMVLSFKTRNETGAPFSVRDVAPVKPEPVTVIVVPPTALAGLKLLKVGAGATLSSFLQPASHKLPTTTLAPV
jgi:hypothetical protein